VRYLLDTNVCIGFLTGRAPAVLERLASLSPSDIAVCSVVKAELFYGAERTSDPAKTLAGQHAFLDQFASLSFDDRAASVAGAIRAKLARGGTPIGPYDLQIASIALVNGLTLVTRNVREFKRVEGLSIENWESVQD
jgi:tRNA(fMet)-specific endonuclease VapC